MDADQSSTATTLLLLQPFDANAMTILGVCVVVGVSLGFLTSMSVDFLRATITNQEEDHPSGWWPNFLAVWAPLTLLAGMILVICFSPAVSYRHMLACETVRQHVWVKEGPDEAEEVQNPPLPAAVIV